MLRIGLVCYEFPPVGGGGGRALYDLAKNLTKKGHFVHVITSKFDGLSELEVREGISIQRIFSFRSQRYLGVLRSTRTTASPLSLYAFFPCSIPYILKAVKSKKLDLLHGVFAIPSGLPTVTVAELCNIPSIVTAAGADIYDPTRYRQYRTVLHPVLRWVIRKASAVTAVSNDMKKRAQMLSGREDIEILPFGIDKQKFFSVARANTEDRHVGITVCRLVQRKRLDILLRAWKEVASNFEDAKLLIVGDGPKREPLRSMAVDMGIGKNVEFLGYVERTKLPNLYASATVFVCSSSHEAFYIAGLEAMASGLPVIAPSVGGIPDWLLHNQTGYLYEFGDHRTLAAHVQEIFTNLDLRNRLGKAAREKAIEFDWERIATRYVHMYHEALAKCSRAT